MLSVATNARAAAELRLDLDQIVREGARRMLAAALEAEVDDYLAAHAAERDEHGRRLVVRNGHARQRQVTTAAGAVAVHAPRVNDRRVDPITGERTRFRSVVLPPWCRKSPKVAEVLPLLYLHGLSTGDFVPALEAFFGSGAGLSAAAVGRLLAGWQADHQAFCQRDLTERDYVYIWADGVHFRVRLEQARLCCLVIVGVRADGTKELVAVADGERESTESWAELLRDLRRRGMRAGRGGRRRRPGAVGGAAGCLPGHPPPARLGPQGSQRARLPTQDRAGRCPQGPERDPGCARPSPRPPRDRDVRARLRHQVAQGGGQDHR
jgi:transposase-like protein